MAAAGEFLEHRGREAALDVDFHALHDAKARAIGGGLRILVVVGDAHHHLHVALRLHGAAHHAEAHDGLAVLGDEARDDGLVGALLRRDLVGVARGVHEGGAAVLQRHAGARHDDAGAEAHVVRLDQRHHHAARVGGGEVHGAALGRGAVAEVLGFLHVEELGARLEVVAVQERLGLDVHPVHVGHEPARIGKRHLGGLDLQVQAVGGVHREARDVELLEDAECDQRDDALAVGREFVHGVAAVADFHRRGPVGLVRGEVGGLHHAAMLGAVRDELLGDLAAVEGLALGGGDLLERCGVVRKAEDLAGLGRAAAGHEGFGVAGLYVQFLGLDGPLAGDGGRDEEAVAAVADGGLEEFLERQLAEALRQHLPAGDAARDRDRVPAAGGHGLEVGVGLGEVLGRPAFGRAARGVDAVELFAVPEDGEEVRADAVGDRFHQRQRDGGGEDGVHGVPALEHHAHPGLRRERLGGGDDVGREDRLTRPAVGEIPVVGCHPQSIKGEPRAAPRKPGQPGAFSLAVSKSSTTRPRILPALSSSSVRLTSDAGRVSTGMGFSFFFLASATTAFSSARSPT